MGGGGAWLLGGLGAGGGQALPLFGAQSFWVVYTVSWPGRGLGINPIQEEVIKSPFGSFKSHAAPKSRFISCCHTKGFL